MNIENYQIRVDDGHAHAKSRYKETEVLDYINLVRDFVKVQRDKHLSLNVHLPFEIQHPQMYPSLEKGLHFIRYGEGLKNIFAIPLYWENSPELVYRTWQLKNGQTDWTHVPKDIDLTLDTGHAMLGASDSEDARNRIRAILAEWGSQIKHIHLHENDLYADEHWPVGNIITNDFIDEIAAGRTFIFEQGEIIFPKAE